MSFASVLPVSTGTYDARTVRYVRASLLLLFTYVFLANAWIGDDAYITLRTVWNFVHGYGLNFNPDERVQAYTDPLWMFVVSAVHLVTGEFFFTVTAISWAFNVAAGAVLLRRARTLKSTTLIVMWLLSSKALVDYTSSGLEYPLNYFLIALFYVRYLDRDLRVPLSNRELRFFVLIPALAFVTRLDTALLFAFPVAEMALRALFARGRKAVLPILVGASPAVLWLVFATFYYGFPLPNTYYAKVANGIPTWLLHDQGWAYLFSSVSHDPLTLGTISLAAMVAWRLGGTPLRAAVSALLYVIYTVSVGGDFMSGRFFAMPFLVAAIAIVPDLDDALVPWAAGGLVLYNLLIPIVPIKTTANYDAAWPWRTQNGIKDERGHWHQNQNLLTFAPFRALPDSPFGREGMSFGAGEPHAAVYCCIGLYGLNAGPDKYVIDDNALSDPLLARLPVSPAVYFDFWAGHYFREVPDGYVASVEHDQNLLTDPLLREYYEKLRNVTRGPVFRASRFRDIWSLNFGYRDLKDQYEKRRPVSLSFPANHPRFLTDAGFRDDRASVMRTTGKAGYLQYGPGIPMAAKFYRARWLGVVDDQPGRKLGFVELWENNQRLDRQPVVYRGDNKNHVIAQLDFQLDLPARAIEYRFYVNQGVSLTLERIELFSGVDMPNE